MARPNRNSPDGKSSSEGSGGNSRQSARGSQRANHEDSDATPPADLSESQKVADKAGTVVDDIDAVLAENEVTKEELDNAEIDEVLEQDAQEFVENYRQRGGQ